VWEWFQLYNEQLAALGYEADGDSDTYAWGSFQYSCDSTIDPGLSDRWWKVHREDCRIVAVNGFSTPITEKRDASRMRYFMNSWVREFGAHRNELPFDKGHFIAHSIGGQIDNGIFAQRRDINRGWHELGRLYRSMERFALNNPGVFVFSRPIYGDGSTCPFFIEYGILKADGTWWVEVFPNRYTFTPFRGLESAPEWRKKSWR
jgi:pimeloyl-ACP methyl ester carboxylesterase